MVLGLAFFGATSIPSLTFDLLACFLLVQLLLFLFDYLLPIIGYEIRSLTLSNDKQKNDSSDIGLPYRDDKERSKS